jgi:uncharacterized surface protein with fasciclin (FAS1) repeats
MPLAAPVTTATFPSGANLMVGTVTGRRVDGDSRHGGPAGRARDGSMGRPVGTNVPSDPTPRDGTVDTVLDNVHPRTRRGLVAVVVTLALGASACGSDSSDTATPTTVAAAPTTAAATPGATIAVPADIVATALTAGVFTTLAGGVVSAGLVDTLRGGPFTVFAPTDAAFAKLPDPVLKAVQNNADILKAALTYHVVSGNYKIADLEDGQALKSVSGLDLKITKDGDKTYVNGNMVAKGDVGATNGVIHVMGDVIVPPIGDVIKVATTLPGFTTLAKLVTQADLVKTLQGTGPFTVFAPIDAAFSKLPTATVTAVTSDAALLKTVLTYHVVAGALNTDQMKDGTTLKTVAGKDLKVTKKDGVTLINGNPIAVQNVQATNGVIQVMGDVLVPPTS